MGSPEIIRPGPTVSFTETWFLYDYTYPGDSLPDLEEIRRYIRASK